VRSIAKKKKENSGFEDRSRWSSGEKVCKEKEEGGPNTHKERGCGFTIAERDRDGKAARRGGGNFSKPGNRPKGGRCKEKGKKHPDFWGTPRMVRGTPPRKRGRETLVTDSTAGLQKKRESCPVQKWSGKES